MSRPLLLILKVVSYAALAIVLGGIAAVTFVNASGVCPRFDEGAVQCTSPIYETIGGIGLFVVLVSAFTGLPFILAVTGFVFLVRDVAALARRPRPPPLPRGS